MPTDPRLRNTVLRNHKTQGAGDKISWDRNIQEVESFFDHEINEILYFSWDRNIQEVESFFDHEINEILYFSWDQKL